MSIAKSIRVPEDIYQYIDNFSGKGFNQKFINIIRDAKETEANRKETIKQLNKQIQEREKYIAEVSKHLDKLASELRSLSFDVTYSRSRHIV